jgi:hypothetical protein
MLKSKEHIQLNADTAKWISMPGTRAGRGAIAGKSQGRPGETLQTMKRRNFSFQD